MKTLKAGIYSPLDKTWMKKLQTILKKAQSHSLKRLRLVKLLKFNDFGKRLNNYMNAKQRVINEVEMERLTFHVYLSEIYDIIGDEPWINEEVNCLANIGSNQTITLGWGAKKKVFLAENLHVGDIIVLSNYGTHWQH